MFSNLQLRPAKPHRRKTSMATRAGIMKRRISHVSASASNVPSLSFMEGLFGDEFPEAFANGDGRTVKSGKSILDLPAELLATVSEHLAKLDIKRLRLASKHLAVNVDLRIDRVYASPNRANLNCLQRILEHPRYRNQVCEIVWDDAQLEEYSDLDSFRHAIHLDETKIERDIENLLDAVLGYEDNSIEYRAFEHDDFFEDGRLTEVAKGILLRRNDQFSRDVIARNAAIMSIEESYEIYRRLYQEEQQVMKRGQDDTALRQALAGFPNVRRVTLSSEVWRPWNLINPHYDTPFFRSLPAGFRKPSVWPWLGYRPHATPAQAAHRDKTMTARDIDRLPSDWRGYSIVIAALLAVCNPQITEFIIDAGNECTGISHQLFAPHNLDFGHTVRMAQYLPIKRLNLSLNLHGIIHVQDRTYDYYAHLNELLRELDHLEHFDFTPNCHRRRDEPSTHEWYFSWCDVISHSLAERLKSLTLRNMNVVWDELVDLVMKLQRVEHVTLDNLSAGRALDDRANWFSLFKRLKSYYADPTTPTHLKPKFTYIEPESISGPYGTVRSRLVDEEIGMFLYEENECPFDDRRMDDWQLKAWVGWVVDDRDKKYKVKASERGWPHDQRSEE